MKQILCEMAAMFVTLIGITGMIGVLFKVDFLMSWNFSREIALPTAVAFVMVGACLTRLLGKK